LALALASARTDISVALDVAAFGELGLTGQVRPVSQAGARVRESARFGMNRVLGPASASFDSAELPKFACARTISEALSALSLQPGG